MRKHLSYPGLISALIMLVTVACASKDYRHQIEEQIEENETAAEPPPSYNIEIEPKIEGEQIKLFPDRTATITFFIGQQADNSLTPGLKPSIGILDDLANGKELDLTVTLYCDLSLDDTLQQRTISYNPETHCSGKATFSIIPNLNAVRDRAGLGRLTFIVDVAGMEIDVIKMDAFVGEPVAGALEAYEPPRMPKLDKLALEDIAMPDLILSIAPPQAYGWIYLAVRPINEDLKTAIRGALNDPEKDVWVLKSGVTANDLGGLAIEAFLGLSALTLRKSKPLHDAYEHVGTERQLSDGTGILRFEEEDTRTILNLMADQGANLYRRVFLRGAEKLKLAMETLEYFSISNAIKRPLRIRILSNNIYAPWQLLYPDQSKNNVNYHLFWGFRYELGTLQLVDSAQARLKTVSDKPKPDEVLFGTWRGISRDGVEDEIKERGEFLRENLERQVGSGIVPVLNKSDFLARIESGAMSLKLIYLYGHASSGSVLFTYRAESGEEIPVYVQGIIGPYFKFSEDANDTLIPFDLDRYTRNGFALQPIVILNACETGTPGTRTADNNGFVGALTRSGARAIVVTEAPVWANFAQQFSNDLINLLFNGEEIRSAVLKVRIKHFRDAGNPFGLLYSLYGNPGARFRIPK